MYSQTNAISWIVMEENGRRQVNQLEPFGTLPLNGSNAASSSGALAESYSMVHSFPAMVLKYS